tara:strand:+ start:597 stop:791 length:195 start_codon:yes stop_codon:yes gene_type:complete
LYEDLIKEIKTVKKTFEGEAKMSDTLFVTFKNGKVWHVPHDPDNIDYQAVLEWVAEGNKIEDSD